MVFYAICKKADNHLLCKPSVFLQMQMTFYANCKWMNSPIWCFVRVRQRRKPGDRRLTRLTAKRGSEIDHIR